MRVISGAYKGRSLQAVPGSSTRPTTDKVKEALFSMIGPYFDGGVCLDLYAGTGGLGIEAISRGMKKGIFIDHDIKAIETIKTNIRNLGIEEKSEIYKNDAERAIVALSKRQIQFDLIFMDPPYAKEKNKFIMDKICENYLLNEGAIIVIEHDRSHVMTSPTNMLSLWKTNQFGETALTIFRYNHN